MASTLVRCCVAALAVLAATHGAPAQDQSVRLHAALEGENRPALCRDRDSAILVLTILSRASDARADNQPEKAQRLSDIASRLEGEICSHPSPDDVVILRCKLDQRDFTGGRVTLVKVSALLRVETSRGEQPFFALTRATIDTAGSSGVDVEEANRRWCGEEGGSDAPVGITPDVVQRVQQRLYDLGFGVRDINGQFSQETVQALIAFQKGAELPPTGQITQLTLQKIDAMTAPSLWVAIAFDGRGNYGATNAQATRRAAEIDAVGKLRSRASYKVSSLPSPYCIAFAVTRYQQRSRRRRTTFTQAFTSAGTSVAVAQQAVLDYCNQQKGGGTCQIREALCADPGASTERFDPKNIPANSPRFDPKNLPLNQAVPGSDGDSSDDK